jgi:hypothetical protein
MEMVDEMPQIGLPLASDLDLIITGPEPSDSLYFIKSALSDVHGLMQDGVKYLKANPHAQGKNGN